MNPSPIKPSDMLLALPVFLLCFMLCLLPLSLSAAPIVGACTASIDITPRIAIISSFSGGADSLIDEMQRNNGDNQFDGCVVIKGYRFTLGKLRRHDVVLVLSNISNINSAMVTQLTIDTFNITHMVFNGIAGGVGGISANDHDDDTPNQAPIGSVVISKRWGFHQEMYFNSTKKNVPCGFLAGLQLNHVLQDSAQVAKTCEFLLGQKRKPGRANKQSLFTHDKKNAFLRDTNVTSSNTPQYFLVVETGKQQLRGVPFPNTQANPATDQTLKFWFVVDDTMFAIAQQLDVELLDCATFDQDGTCEGSRLDPAPRIIAGENGVSGPTWVDNARYRQFVARTLNFDEQGHTNDQTDVLVLDMATAPSAMVAESNGIPFIAALSVSDLAGGGGEASVDELNTFFRIVAENQARVALALIDRL